MHSKITILRRVFAGVIIALIQLNLVAAEEFRVEINRSELKNNLLTGTISVNGKLLGKVFENDDLRIPTGTYKGIVRYSSAKNFVQGPGGVMSEKGDFLLEVASVKHPSGKPRTDILLHGGNLPKHSKGCILLGPVALNPGTGDGQVTPDHPLYKLRLAFYETAEPIASPNKNIVVIVTESVPRVPGTWKGTSGYYKNSVWTFRANGVFIEENSPDGGPWYGKWKLEGKKITIKMDIGNGGSNLHIEGDAISGKTFSGTRVKLKRH